MPCLDDRVCVKFPGWGGGIPPLEGEFPLQYHAANFSRTLTMHSFRHSALYLFMSFWVNPCVGSLFHSSSLPSIPSNGDHGRIPSERKKKKPSFRKINGHSTDSYVELVPGNATDPKEKARRRCHPQMQSEIRLPRHPHPGACKLHEYLSKGRAGWGNRPGSSYETDQNPWKACPVV